MIFGRRQGIDVVDFPVDHKLNQLHLILCERPRFVGKDIANLP